MITLPSGIKKVEASDNATVTNMNRNDDLIDTKITALNTHIGAGGTAHPVVTTTTAGFASAADKTKLDGIATGANNYTHPANHPPSIITQDANNRFVTDAEKTTWNGKASTSVATTGANGLMSASDKSKLDGIATGAGTANSATDTVIGTRTINDAIAVGTVDTDTPTNLFSKIGAMIRAITGKADWFTAPAITLEATKTHIDSTAPHSATAAATASRLVLRDASGRAQFADPSAAGDAATKGYVDASRPYVAGTYTGNGVVPRTISLPFTPSAVLVIASYATDGSAYHTSNLGLAVTGSPSGAVPAAVTVTTNGFILDDVSINTGSVPYNYIAFK